MPPRLAPPAAPTASGSVGSVAIASRAARPVLQTSKEWVVPPRPKPGRKSTKTAADKSSKSSQKAFKERRQEYVVELEEKVRQLEAGEGEKCVFYQQQAQRAKAESTAALAENDQLRRDVEKLRKEVESLKSIIASGGGAGASAKGKSRALPDDFEETGPRQLSKRPKRSAAVRAQAVVAAAASPSSSGSTSATSSSSSITTRRRLSNASHASSHPSPTASLPSHANSPPALAHSAPVFAHSPLHENHPASPVTSPPQALPPTSHLTANAQPPSTSCGFCSTTSDCLCAEIGYEYSSSSTDPTAAAANVRSSSIKLENAASPRLSADGEDALFANETRYEPAVPIRLARNRAKVASVWRIDPPAQNTSKFETVVAVAEKALCSGDPSNCPACSDDPFGKAFCTTLAATVCSTPCANCPGNCATSTPSGRIPTPPPEAPSFAVAPPAPAVIDADEAALFESLTDLPCCGDPELCGSLTCRPASSTPASTASGGGPSNSDTVLLPRSVEPGVRTVETVPCNEAWSVLKAHPNIAFANLQMLAEVVSKRTHCSGPVASPIATGSPHGTTRTSSSTQEQHQQQSRGTDAFASSASPRPQLAPQSVLQCQIDAGVRKRLTVERGAVNEALELLDRAAARGGALRR
ncbi:hypothetical protein JCM3766R1_006854 [Sporobolomyces carnicolor]